MASTVFPAFLKLEHQADGSAKSSFLAEVAAITGDAEKQFERSFGEIRQVITNTLAGFKGSDFKLNFDMSGLRQAAADADFAAQRLRTVRDSASALATATGDTTQETRRYIQALSAQAIEAEGAKRAADAQVTTYSRLQGEIDRTISSNERLAQSYRDTFLEQARSVNAATEAQRQFNALSAPGLNRPVKSAASSASVFENQAYKPTVDTRTNVDKLVQGSASIDRAALSAASLDQVLGRVAAKGPLVAAGLKSIEQASEAVKASAERAAAQVIAEQEQIASRAAAAQASLAQEAGQLRAALDPTVAIQKRFDDEMERAERLYQANAIGVREYAAAQAMARTNLQESYTAITRVGDAQEMVAKRGTTAQQNVINSTRASRNAYMMLGQQMQDMTVQAQMGTSAFVIFGQQIPQAAFALSGLEGSANKTQNAIGKVATFMSGPWGAAIFVAIAVLGPFIQKLFETTDGVDKLYKKLQEDAQAARDGAEAHRLFSNTLEGQIALQDKLTEALDNSIKSQRQLNEEKLREQTANRDNLQAGVETAKADLETARKRRDLADEAARMGAGDPDAAAGLLAAAAAADRKVGQAQANLINVTKSLGDAERGIRAATVPLIKDDVADAMDSKAGAVRRLKDQMDTLTQSYANGSLAEGAYRSKSIALQKQIDALSATASSANRQSGREVDLAGASSIAKGAGFNITSGHRTYEEQKWLYDHKRTAANPVALPGTSAHEKDRALDIADGAGVNPASIRKAFAEEGVRLTKVLKETGHFHIEWSTSGADKAQRESEAIARAQQVLKEQGERSAETIKSINERFDKQPKLIDSAAASTRKLQDIINDMSDTTHDRPPNFQQLITDAEAAKGVIEQGLLRPFEELQKSSERRIQLAELMAGGREAEANAMQDIWQLEDQIGTEEELRAQVTKLITEGRTQEAAVLQSILSKYPALIQGVKDQAENEYRINEALKARQVVTDAYLNATRSIRGELESLFSGDGADFGKIFKRLQAQLTVEKLFGDSLRKLEQTIKTGGLQSSVDTLSTTTDGASTAVKSFADTMIEQTARIASASTTGASGGLGAVPGGGDLTDSAYADFLSDFDDVLKNYGAANDNASAIDPATGAIIVNGAKPTVTPPPPRPDRSTVGGTNLTTYSELVAGVMTKPLTDAIGQISPELAGKLGPMLNGAIGGYMTGGIPGAVLGGLKELPGISKSLSKALGKGLEGAQTGTMVAGLAKSLGVKMSTTGAQLGGAIGSFIPIPGGNLIGSVIGGLLGTLFHSVKSGYAQIRPSGEDVAVTGTYGRTGDLQNNAKKAANALIDTMRSLAERVGGTLSGYDQDVGTKDGKFAVTSSRLAAQGYGGGTAWFDTEEEAIRFAIRDALSAGAIKGIREGTKRLLQAGTDIEAQLTKAMDFENVFKRLKVYTDPVGAAIDTVDKEFTRLQGIFKEAGASSAEYADLEKLYGLERTKAVKEALSQTTSALQGFLDDLKIGEGGGLSLTDRKANAMAAYQPLAQRVQAGDATAYDEFVAAARALVDIQRQIYGSQNPYFDLVNEVEGIAQGALTKVTAAANGAASSPSIFSTSTAAANDNANLVSAINGVGSTMVESLGTKLDATNENLGILIRQAIANGNTQQLADVNVPMWQPQGSW